MNYALRLAMAAIALTGPLLGDTRKICQDKTNDTRATCRGDAWNQYQKDLGTAQSHYNECMDPNPRSGSSLGGCAPISNHQQLALVALAGQQSGPRRSGGTDPAITPLTSPGGGAV
jgi:hypothetical protein